MRTPNEMFVTNKMLIANKISSIEDNDKLIEKSIKLKTKKLPKLRKFSKF